MQPVAYSSSSRQWRKAGTNISYGPTNFEHTKGRYFYLSFRYQFEAGESVYFAYSYPYSYSHLRQKVRRWEKEGAGLLEVRSYATSLCGNQCFELALGRKDGRARPMVLVMARVHSGESVSSFVCEGIVDFLLSRSAEADMLLDNYSFLVFPMINVDGVIHGNYRASLSGHDLNRRWASPSKKLHP
jgi:murein tripeptide amidase MpaA